MIETRVGPLAIIFAIVGGLIVGLVLGLLIGWLVWPVQATNVDVPDLNNAAQDDYIVLTASAFAYDQDLVRAEERLALIKDAHINERVAILAKTLAAQNRQEAGYVAMLALALGAEDDMLARLAATATPTPSLTPTPTQTRTVTPTATPTVAATATLTATRTRTAVPKATATPKPAPVAGTEWIPGFPGEWPPGAKFTPANAAPGQKYWHLTKALYCDDRDQRNDCPNLPGGDVGTNVYVMLSPEGGGRAGAALLVDKGNGNYATVDDIGPEKPANDMCNCNYSFMANGWPISVAGAPSDTVSGLALYSVRMKLPQAHTKYFLWFQTVTR